MVRILLIRHGETEWNAQHRFDGQEDTELSHQGKKQIKMLAHSLSQEPIVHILSSSLSRAKLTAEAIAKVHNLPVVLSDELKEIDCGSCTGLTRELISKKFPDLISEWKKNTDPPFPNGECLKDVEKRVLPVIASLVDTFRDETVVVSGHGTVNVAIIGYYLGADPALRFRIRQSNCCINELNITKNTCVITRVNRDLS